MLSISVEVDIEKTLRALNQLERELVPRAAAMAINRVATSARAEAVREISREANLPQAQIRQRISIRGADRYRLMAEIQAHPWSPNLIRYGARQTKQGVSAAPWRKRRVHKGTFIGNQGRTVFARQGKARLPLKPIRGPSVRREFMRGYALRAMERKVAERFKPEFDRALQKLMRDKGWR